MSPVFVAISGKKQHGKNYFAKRLRARLAKEELIVVEDAFANPIKRFCADAFGIDEDDMATEAGKQKNTHLRWCDLHLDLGLHLQGSALGNFLTIRELLQIIGTEVFRDGFYGPIWAEAPFRKKHTVPVYCGEYKQSANADVVLITDTRFPNEVVEAKRHNAIMVRVVRDTDKRQEDFHTSETALDDYEWGGGEVVINKMNDECFDEYIEKIIIPKIKGQLYGH